MNGLVQELIARNFQAARGELFIGGLRVTSLASEYGTPLFVYDCAVVDRTLALLRDTLPPEFAISYSVKANPNSRILRHFVERNCGLEVASAGEFLQALHAGCPPEQIVFAGPSKTEAELEFVLRKGIGEIHAESMLEVQRISSIGRHLGRRAPVAVRVNPGSDSEGGAMRMGGRPAPFGIDEESLEEVLETISRDSAIEFCGVHLFVGTQILDFRALLNQYQRGAEIASRVAQLIRMPMKTVDFGGGLGIPYFAHERELDMNGLRAGLCALMAELQSNSHFRGTRFMVEPGRYLVGEAGLYLARINDIKSSRGKRFVILDGGMNHHLAASGNLGQTIKRNFPVAILNKLDAPATETFDVVGPLCTPLDVIARELRLPRPEIGDIVGVFQSGAYARSASPLGFLSHPTPPEVWVESGQHELIRRRGEPTDYLRDQVRKVPSAQAVWG